MHPEGGLSIQMERVDEGMREKVANEEVKGDKRDESSLAKQSRKLSASRASSPSRFCILRFPPSPMSADRVRSRANGSRTSPTRGCPSPPSSVARSGVNYNREVTSRWLSENPQERARKSKRKGTRKGHEPSTRLKSLIRADTVHYRASFFLVVSPSLLSLLADASNFSRVLAYV